MRLLQDGATINATTASGRSALIYAAMNNDLESVTSLLGRGADVNQRDDTGKTALIWAVLRNPNACQGVVKTLLDFKANPNAKDVHNLTALLLAKAMDKPALVQLLRQRGARE